jgi:hypothetical protein
MPGFFEALDNFKNKETKKHFVTVEGQTVEVSLEKKLEIMKAGIDAWTIQKTSNGIVFVKNPIIPKEQRQTELIQSEKGTVFYEHNPFWPVGKDNKGYTWQIK